MTSHGVLYVPSSKHTNGTDAERLARVEERLDKYDDADVLRRLGRLDVKTAVFATKMTFIVMIAAAVGGAIGALFVQLVIAKVA